MIRVRAITLWQPWAYAVACGFKDIENRPKPWRYRGPLAIHAGQKTDPKGLDVVRGRLLDMGVLKNRDEPLPNQHLMVSGAVLAVVRMTGCCNDAIGTKVARCGCSAWAAAGQFHYQLIDSRPLPEPIRMPGQQGVWWVDLPEEVLSR